MTVSLTPDFLNSTISAVLKSNALAFLFTLAMISSSETPARDIWITSSIANGPDASFAGSCAARIPSKPNTAASSRAVNI